MVLSSSLLLSLSSLLLSFPLLPASFVFPLSVVISVKMVTGREENGG